MEKQFEKASRLKLRFETTKGLISTEDLWDLSLTSLDTIAKAVNKKIKDEAEESFLGKKSKSSTELALKLEIVVHIIKVKEEETEKAKARIENVQKLARLKEALADVENTDLKKKSADEIRKEIEALQGNI